MRSVVPSILLILAPPLACLAAEVPVVAVFDEVLPVSTRIEGREAGDALGIEVLPAGDIDGDGYRDLAFLARYPAVQDGRILLGFKWLEARLDLDGWQPWGIEISGRDRPPCPRACLGDIDGDGLDDLAFSAATGGPEAGGGVILFGDPALPRAIDADSFNGCRAVRILPDTALVPLGAVPYLHAFGSGDFDGDGIRDLAVSTSHLPDPGALRRGLVFIGR